MSHTNREHRDFIEERTDTGDFYAPVPLQMAFGLNRFELFQGINSFLRQTAEGLISFIPFVGSSQGYINDSLRLTRYRNFHHESI